MHLQCQFCLPLAFLAGAACMRELKLLTAALFLTEMPLLREAGARAASETAADLGNAEFTEMQDQVPARCEVCMLPKLIESNS